MSAVPRDPGPFDWNAEMDSIENEHMLRLDDHLTAEETAARLAEIDRQIEHVRALNHRRQVDGPPRCERPWQSILGLIGSGVIALMAVALLAVLL